MSFWLKTSQSSKPTLRVIRARVKNRTPTAVVTSATQIVWRMIKSLVWSGGLTRFADTPGGAGIAPPPTSLPDMVCCDDDEWTAGGDARADGLELFKKFF